MEPAADVVGPGTLLDPFEKNKVILIVGFAACLTFEAVTFFAALRHPGEPRCCKKFLLPPSLTQILWEQILQV